MSIRSGRWQVTAPIADLSTRRPAAMPGHDMSTMHGAPSAGAAVAATGDVSFPVAFPSAGSYRVFVQVRRVGKPIETAALDVTVPAPPTR